MIVSIMRNQPFESNIPINEVLLIQEFIQTGTLLNARQRQLLQWSSKLRNQEISGDESRNSLLRSRIDVQRDFWLSAVEPEFTDCGRTRNSDSFRQAAHYQNRAEPTEYSQTRHPARDELGAQCEPASGTFPAESENTSVATTDQLHGSDPTGRIYPGSQISVPETDQEF
jgi:hypothetical protein